MTRRPRRLVFALVCLTPVLITVTLRYGESTWVVPAGFLPFFLLGPTRLLAGSLLTAAAFWIALALLSAATKRSEWHPKWRTVRGLALLSLVALGLVVAALTMVTRQKGIMLPSWAGAAAIAWELYLLSLTRHLAAEPRGSVLVLRLWLLAVLVPSVFALAMGTLAGLCC